MNGIMTCKDSSRPTIYTYNHYKYVYSTRRYLSVRHAHLRGQIDSATVRDNMNNGPIKVSQPKG